MSTKKLKFKLSSILTTAAAVLIALTAACGGPKIAPKPDNEPGLRENKGNMMNRMDTTMRR